MLLRQKSKHETRRRKGILVSKSYEDYEIEWWDCCGIWFRDILPSLAPTEINGSPVKDRSHIRLNQETLAQQVGWISETPSTKIICDNRMNAGGWRCAYPPYLLLAQGGWIDAELADKLKRMVGFRNIAVHDYQALQLPILISIIEMHLDEFLEYSHALLLGDV